MPINKLPEHAHILTAMLSKTPPDYNFEDIPKNARVELYRFSERGSLGA